MEGAPGMPALPAAGVQPDDEMIGEAVLASAKRKIMIMLDDTSPAGKRLLGEDNRRVFEMTATAALPNIVNENNVLQRMEQQLGRMEQQLGRVEQRLGRIEQGQLVSRHNERARRLNRRAVSTVGNAALQPLRREEEAAAGGAYQLGALPTADIQFPEDTDALRALSGPQMDRLQQFYGQRFVGGTVPERRKSFEDYVCL